MAERAKNPRIGYQARYAGIVLESKIVYCTIARQAQRMTRIDNVDIANMVTCSEVREGYSITGSNFPQGISTLNCITLFLCPTIASSMSVELCIVESAPREQ